MRVALIHPKIDTLGGAEYYTYRLAEGLIHRGHTVHLYARKARSVPEGAVVHRVPTVAGGRGLKALSFCWSACRKVDGERYDIVHGLGKTTCQAVHRTGGGVHRAYLERAGTRRHTFYDRVAVRIEDELFTSTRLKAIICPSDLIRSEVKRLYPAAEPKIRIIPNGVKTETFAPDGRDRDRRDLRARLGLPADGIVLLFMGTNFHRKGLEIAIDALPHLPSAHLVIGGGDASGPFEAQAASVGVGDRVHFVGFQDARPPLYRAADVFVLPTRYDPFANVCLESLACGTPVVTSDQNGASDILKGEWPGEVSPLSAGGEGVAAKVKLLLERGPACRENARELALRHGQANHVAEVEGVYSEVRQARSVTG